MDNPDISQYGEITLAIELTYDSENSDLRQVTLKYQKFVYRWIRKLVFDGKAKVTTRGGQKSPMRVARALISHSLGKKWDAHLLGERCGYHYISGIWAGLPDKDANKTLLDIFGTGPGCLYNLFDPDSKPLQFHAKHLPSHAVRVLVKTAVDDDDQFADASPALLCRIVKGIDPFTGEFTAQKFDGPLYAKDVRFGEYSPPVANEPPSQKTVDEKEEGTVPPTPHDEFSPECVYGNIISEIERLLRRRPVLAQFLEHATDGLIDPRAGSPQLAAAVKSREFPLGKFLASIVRELEEFSGSVAEWQALGEVAGGLVVLAIDRKWVVEHKANARTASAEFSAYDEILHLGEGREVNLLHLLTCALADSLARLENVFGKPSSDGRRLPDVAVRGRGNEPVDLDMEAHLRILDFVLQPTKKIEANDPQLVSLMQQCREIVTAAFQEGAPYYATGKTYQPHIELLRNELKLVDVLLLFPSGGKPNSLLPDNAVVLRNLGRIFDAVRTRTSSPLPGKSSDS